MRCVRRFGESICHCTLLSKITRVQCPQYFLDLKCLKSFANNVLVNKVIRKSIYIFLSYSKAEFPNAKMKIIVLSQSILCEVSFKSLPLCREEAGMLILNIWQRSFEILTRIPIFVNVFFLSSKDFNLRLHFME